MVAVTFHFAPVNLFLSGVLLRSWLSHCPGFNNDQTTRLLFETNVTKWPLGMVSRRFIVLQDRLAQLRRHFGWITQSHPSFWCSNVSYYTVGTFKLILVHLNIHAVSVTRL